jgi:hypothetical protein
VLPVLPLNVLESADFGQGMVMDNLMSSLPPAAGAVQVSGSSRITFTFMFHMYINANPRRRREIWGFKSDPSFWLPFVGLGVGQKKNWVSFVHQPDRNIWLLQKWGLFFYL